ncbi:MAG: ankyrin repeat domain-containing protein, partial [Sandaracinus sp.]
MVNVCARSPNEAAGWTLKPPRLSGLRHETVFSLACAYAPFEIVEALYRLKMHVRPAASKFPPHRAPSTPLVAATENEDPRILEALLHLGWDANEADEEGDTALHRVLGDVARVRLLLRYGANPLQSNAVGVTPLTLAEEQPHWYPDALSTMRASVVDGHLDSSRPTVEWSNTH